MFATSANPIVPSHDDLSTVQTRTAFAPFIKLPDVGVAIRRTTLHSRMHAVRIAYNLTSVLDEMLSSSSVARTAHTTSADVEDLTLFYTACKAKTGHMLVLVDPQDDGSTYETAGQRTSDTVLTDNSMHAATPDGQMNADGAQESAAWIADQFVNLLTSQNDRPASPSTPTGSDDTPKAVSSPERETYFLRDIEPSRCLVINTPSSPPISPVFDGCNCQSYWSDDSDDNEGDEDDDFFNSTSTDTVQRRLSIAKTVKGALQSAFTTSPLKLTQHTPILSKNVSRASLKRREATVAAPIIVEEPLYSPPSALYIRRRMNSHEPTSTSYGALASSPTNSYFRYSLNCLDEKPKGGRAPRHNLYSWI